MTSQNALVLFSGGQDSTVCLAWALARYNRVTTVGFDYAQRHSVELNCRQNVLEAFRKSSVVRTDHLGDDVMLDLSILGQIAETSLTRDAEIRMTEDGLPSTFVPARNLIFFSLSGTIAYRQAANILVGGMCETDYSGYPDCRRATLDAQEQTLSLGLDRDIVIETPLMHKTKADTFALAKSLGGEELVEIVVEHTHTCYLGDRSTRHDWGYGCGTCPACELRAKGWNDWQEAGCPKDPTGLA
ncbi:MAG: 7-cyano-7-deazaguanine synthase QueC [Ponticaulis sp.]|nr:7-cyano-7-deazaguanine synthase QueC [Ponticaulis sp.]